MVLKTIEQFVADTGNKNFMLFDASTTFSRKQFLEFISLFFISENIFDDIYIAFLDPTNLEHIPGWPLRNLLSLLKIQV